MFKRGKTLTGSNLVPRAFPLLRNEVELVTNVVKPRWHDNQRAVSIWPYWGGGRIKIKGARVKFLDCSKRRLTTDTYNCTYRQLLFNKHSKCRYIKNVWNFNPYVQHWHWIKINILTGSCGRIKQNYRGVYRLGFQNVLYLRGFLVRKCLSVAPRHDWPY